MARSPFKTSGKGGTGWARKSATGAAKPARNSRVKAAPMAQAPVAAGTILLPWPPSSLSGHANGHWRPKHTVTAAHRRWAHIATLEVADTLSPQPERGDIRIHVSFVPPNRRGDRTNFPNRLKPYFDGIADALALNDRRFLPSYEYAEPEHPGRVEVVLCPAQQERDA